MTLNEPARQHELIAFSPAMLALQSDVPSPMPRTVLWILVLLVGGTVCWATLGKLDVVSVAEGKLVPQSYLQVAQPADGGIVREILVTEGEVVEAGQVLARLDPVFSEADNRQIQIKLQLETLQLARIDAELTGGSLRRGEDIPTELYAQVLSQLRANRQAYFDTIEAERSVKARAEQELRSAIALENKLRQTAPIYEAQEQGWKKLAEEGFAGTLMALERERLRIENEQELRAQEHTIAGLRARIKEVNQRMAQVTSNYRQKLESERMETLAQLKRLEEDWNKQSHRHRLLELRSPDEGIVKELATHTAGAVVQPGTVLFTIVPQKEPLRAEVWVSNGDVGFVHEGQTVKVKVAAFPFQKYGMIDGKVAHLSADASDLSRTGAQSAAPRESSRYKALVELVGQVIERDGVVHALSPGMQVNAEIKLGERTVLDYILSPVQKAFHRAGRER
ncbi:MAG: HlyD family type I secretion periplasmic adaptor subunit [Betaproteobacteria bacterium]|nr:MAG: HlyD family type I secretion periplasmic adaptor subunit [Betaproteobacteria bacterium]